MNNITFFIFEFIFKIRLKQINRKKLSIISYVKSKYDKNVHKILNKYEKTIIKLQKCKFDLIFIHKCKTLEVLPNFVQFKIANKKPTNSKIILELNN